MLPVSPTARVVVSLTPTASVSFPLLLQPASPSPFYLRARGPVKSKHFAIVAPPAPQWPHTFRTISISNRLDTLSVCLGWNRRCTLLPLLRVRGPVDFRYLAVVCASSHHPFWSRIWTSEIYFWCVFFYSHFSAHAQLRAWRLTSGAYRFTHLHSMSLTHVAPSTPVSNSRRHSRFF